jgi:Phosphotransferase enzyme family
MGPDVWQPEPEWLSVPGGTGPSTVGVWRTQRGGQPLAVKRLGRPRAGDPPELSDPTHFAYWRREADVAESGLNRSSPGLVGPMTAVEEDDDGITLVSEWVEDAGINGLFVAHALGRFAAADLGERPWLARDLLRRRLGRIEHRGGWPTLARTSAADLADALWTRREHFLQQYDALPLVPHHGDVTVRNVRGRDGDLVVAIDWQSLGTGPAGTDLGLHMAGARESPEPLADSYLLGLAESGSDVATADQVRLGARIVASYTAVSRAEWALARVATGEGALAAKFRHPSVAPYLRALERVADEIEALVRV